MMKTIAAILLCASAACCESVKGIDVSAYQPNVNWQQVRANGVKFVYIKATEGTSYKSPAFNAQYSGASVTAGLIRGAYHFALPNASSGVVQANYFASNGGGWTGDGRTLPGAVDLEYNPYKGNQCYGLSAATMVQWIRDFSNTYKGRTGRHPVIYTSVSWWKQCTGDYSGFGEENPLWIARYGSAAGELPAGWSFYSFWQYTNRASPNPGDGDFWNGSLANLQKFSRG